ncbi:DUF2613 domain-containing protein [Mycobacterium ahvazicum]|uniref:DUF2613 domain-containing protein n=1 Tax=Mycobacterium ahvazicum TaxID=1964395 RepID=A0A2K4Y4M8_9MYCO|nr:DUF2613 family protein [Mycobacterium ahvazicum]SOX51739.1 DUF2613 domain-containing protein [Mycobacterium ahvazicum]
MTAFTLAAAAGIAAGLAIGAVATVGVTLAAEDHTMVPARAPSHPSSHYLVQYGDRCSGGSCFPGDSPDNCLTQTPPIPGLPPELQP